MTTGIRQSPAQELVADHYQVTVRCGNCFEHQVLVAPKGVTVIAALTALKCLKCGISDLHKVVSPS